MDMGAAERYLRLLDLAQSDAEYRRLSAAFRSCDETLLALLARLPEADSHLVLDYLGAFGALWERLLEISLQQ